MDQARKSSEATAAKQVPETLADVAFVDIRDICAAARIGETTFYAEVKAGRAPQPIRFGPRCSRWPLAAIREWLLKRAESAANQQDGFTVARARKAGAVALAKRKAGRASAQAA